MPDYPPSGRDPLLHFGARVIFFELMKLDISDLVCKLNVKSSLLPSHMLKFCSMGVHSGFRDRLKVCEISADVSETVQNIDVVTMED